VSALRIYVAASSGEMERAEKWMAKLRAAGHTVTSSWPEVVRKVGSANPMTAPRELRAQWAMTDLQEVEQSNALWLLLPEKPSAGAYTEFGFSAAMVAGSIRAQQIGVDAPPYFSIVSGKETSIFTALVPHYETDEAAFAWLDGELAPLLTRIAEAEDAADDDDEEEAALPPAIATQLDEIFAKAK
jgi:hypothetical protein